MRAGVVAPLLTAVVLSSAPAVGQAAEVRTLHVYGHGRCDGKRWVLKSTTAHALHTRLKPAVLSDTDGDGLTDRIDSWAVSKSNALKDRAGHRDGWVEQGSHYVLLWDYSTGTWSDEPEIIKTWPMKFKITCIRR